MKKFAKILCIVAVAMVLFIAAFVAFDLLITWIAVKIGTALGIKSLLTFDGSWWVLIALMFLPKGWIFKRLRLNRPYVCHATTDIDAPIAEVWDMYRLRPRTDYHSPTMPVVEAVAGKPDHFDLVVDDRFTTDGDIPARIQMRVDETIENFYIRMTCLNADTLPLFGKDLENTEIWMERVEGKTRVTYAENLSQLSLTAVAAFLFLNPAKDGLKQVKSRLEGTEDTSWMTKSMNDVGPNGEASAASIQTQIMIMAAVTIVGTALCFGAVGLVFWLAG